MNSNAADILIVGGGAAGMAAALAASETADVSITIVDDNPYLGGQIWRVELGKTKSPEAKKLIDAISSGRIDIINNAQVFAAPEKNLLAAETPDGRLNLEYGRLVTATGARERFLPFPGWTLPGVFGAGGLQALVKGGMKIEGKRVVVAGTGALLLAVADYLKSKGGQVVAIAEQTSAAKLRRFAIELRRSPAKLLQAARIRAKLLGVPYMTDCWIVSANSCASPRVSKGESLKVDVLPLLARGLAHPMLESVVLTRKGRTWKVDCDYVACGFHLVPNIEIASLLGCRIEDGFVAVDEFQRTSCENVYCAGEPTGVGGVEKSLVEGKIAGYSAAGNDQSARRLFRERNRTMRFQRSLDRTFELRDELSHLTDDETIVCRCEDVAYGCLKGFATAREAKLQTRSGMGPCQGRICGAATEFLFGWEHDSVRPPIFPVRMENL